ncbi:MAG: hypothetical protein ACR2QF_03055 [Geminicoccaceae bacterium]
MTDPKPFDVEVLSVRRYKIGYEVRTERHWVPRDEAGNVDPIEMLYAYTPSGDWIGDSRWAHRLFHRYGVTKPEVKDCHVCEGDEPPRLHPCSIGFNEAEQKWYGWSHRAIYGFGVGSVVDSADHCCATSGWTDEYVAEHPELDLRLPVGFTAQSLADAKRMAIAFADSVS